MKLGYNVVSAMLRLGRRQSLLAMFLVCIAIISILPTIMPGHNCLVLVKSRDLLVHTHSWGDTNVEPSLPDLDSVGTECDSSETCLDIAKNYLEAAGISTFYSSLSDVRRKLALYFSRHIPQFKLGVLQAQNLPQLIAFFHHPMAIEVAKARARSMIITNQSRAVNELVPKEWKRHLKEQAGKYDLAFVLPFHTKELPKVADWIASWEKHPPCGPDRDPSVRVHFVWAYAEDFTTPRGKKLRKELERLWSQRRFGCFESVHYLSLKQDAGYGHLDGACITFYVLTQLMKNRFNFMQIMETDVRPIRSGWATAITQIVEPKKACRDWWVKGSPSMCSPDKTELDVRHDMHINGNSLYVLGCPDFEDYLHKVQLFYPARPDKGLECQFAAGCETDRQYEGGYDHILFQYRQEPENSDYARSISHRFMNTFFVVNKCDDLYDPEKVAAYYPSAYLVHSKGVFMPDSTQAIFKAFEDVLLRTPTEEELISLLPQFHSGELDPELLRSQLREHKDVPTHGFIDKWERAYSDKVYLWTTDFHAGPVSCNMPIYRDAGAVTHAEVDFANCVYFGYCKQRLKVLEFDQWRGFSLECGGKKPEALKKDFYEAYKDDAEFKRVDAFLCSHPAANCELFLKFNKSVIVYATTRLEFGRHDGGVFWRRLHWNPSKGLASWEVWIKSLIEISKDPKSIIAANNLYDVNYIKYFTGITPQYIPSWCGDANYAYTLAMERRPPYKPRPTYHPTSDVILLGSYRTNLDLDRDGKKKKLSDHPIMQDLHFSAGQKGIRVVPLKKQYPEGFIPEDLCSHPAIVIIPYQTSTISLFEYYRLNIPLFVPSNALLLEWWRNYDILWERIYGWPERLDNLIGSSSNDSFIPDPNSNSEESFKYWIKFADFNVFPHVQRFNDFDDLMKKLRSVDLRNVSMAMMDYNRKERQRLVKTWKSVFRVIKHGR